MTKAIAPLRGTRDLLGKELELHSEVIALGKRLAKLYCYQEIATPIFEHSSVFHRTMGETSDVVSKETYTFLDRDKIYITLRPEFTAGVARALISNGLTQNLPVKFFSHGPLFRHERPQSCRYRQFHQLNFEFFGSSSPAADVEMILLAFDILRGFGLEQDVVLQLNSIGDSASRGHYVEALTQYLAQHRSSLSEESLKRLEKNPLRILDSKNNQDREILAAAPLISEYLSPGAAEYQKKFLSILASLNIPYELNPFLVRGLDYYTHTVFEFVTRSLGAQGTLIAGGRYDGLVKLMGGPDICGIGFAAGIERLVALSIATSPDSLNLQEFQVHLIPIGAKAEAHAMQLSWKLRKNGFNTYIEYETTLKKRMQQANKRGAHVAIVFGDTEMETEQYQVKDMINHNCDSAVGGKQMLVLKGELVNHLSKMRAILNL